MERKPIIAPRSAFDARHDQRRNCRDEKNPQFAQTGTEWGDLGYSSLSPSASDRTDNHNQKSCDRRGKHKIDQHTPSGSNAVWPTKDVVRRLKRRLRYGIGGLRQQLLRWNTRRWIGHAAASFQCGRVILICSWWIRKKVFAVSSRDRNCRISRSQNRSPTIL